MDYILRKIENDLELNEPGSYEYITCLRMRIEYCLFFCLGYLWKNMKGITQDERNRIFDDFKNLSIGSTVSAIRTLDINKDIFVKKSTLHINNYPGIRNEKMGHGYALAASIASALEPLYNELINNIPLLRKEWDIIIVKNYDTLTQTYTGVRFPYDRNGQGVRWSCHAENFESPETNFPRTYILAKDELKYYKISPFVFVEDNGLMPYVFTKLTEKVLGKTQLVPLFPIAHNDDLRYEYNFHELICIRESDGYRCISKSNGTIMNDFQPNYHQYIDIGIESLMRNFLLKNRAYVAATIWGHGGVGKTARIQNMCYTLFNDSKKHFSYIIYITAKDRVFNNKTGEIDSFSNNTRFYSDIIATIARTVFDCTDSLNTPEKIVEYENMIIELKEKMLIVIDDYETFEDSEKSKISLFLKSLDIDYHKVIITTRNNRFVIGEEIPTNEFDLNTTKSFIEGVVQAQFGSHYGNIQKLLSDAENMKFIHKATAGRPIFIYQFINIFVQKGFQEDIISSIRSSKNAQEFLYGRIIQYLAPNARHIFATISAIADSDLQFRINVLEYVLSKFIPDKNQFEIALKEILDQRIIERITDLEYGRVYTLELFAIMKNEYAKYPQDFQDTIRNMIESIGGKDIKGGIVEAILEQADKSRTFGNEKETVEKYRRVLKSPDCAYDVRKSALKRVADYLANARLNPVAAISIVDEYLALFSDDADIYIMYISLLWSQNSNEKERAVNAIQTFFSNPEHRKTSNKYLKFFALGVGYRIGFDLQFREYKDDMLRRAQYLNTFNEYGRFLFEHIKRFGVTGNASIFHNIRIALIQTIKLCIALSACEKNHYKRINNIEYGSEICKWMRNSGLKEPFLSQIVACENELSKAHIRKSYTKNIGDADILQFQMDYNVKSDTDEREGVLSESGQYSVGDIVKVTITGIQSYGVFADISTSITGLIHISEIADRYITNIYNEFKVGEVCQAKILDIDENTLKASLSTMGLR